MQAFLPNPVAFTIAGKSIYWYAIFITLSMILAVWICTKRAKKIGWKSDDIIDVALFALPSAIIGARLYYVIFEWGSYKNNLADIFKIWNGGLAIFGGIIGGMIAGYFVCRYKKKNYWDLLDIAVPTIALGQAIGRWGNFFNQEAFGGVVTNQSMQFFPMSVYIEKLNEYHYATFFYESLWCFLLFVFLMMFGKKFKHRGDITLTYFMLYSLERGFVEGLRTDSLYIGSIRVSQALSIILFLGILIFFIVRKIRERNKPILITNAFNSEYHDIEENSVDLNDIAHAEKETSRENSNDISIKQEAVMTVDNMDGILFEKSNFNEEDDQEIVIDESNESKDTVVMKEDLSEEDQKAKNALKAIVDEKIGSTDPKDNAENEIND